ncbi:MAG: hypothetical protein RR957_02385, partial [Oscillospiraceae bacterium]
VGGKNYSVTCGVSVPSFFEFNKYKAKLGWYDNLGVNCDGVGSNIENGTAIVYASWLRTPANVESGQKTLAVGTKISDWSGKLKIVNNSKGYTRDVAVRPQFWLKKDFFKTNKVVVSTLGSDVIRVLNETYTRDDFAPLGYTPEELKLIFGEPFNIGTSSFVDNTGQQMKTLVGGADITGKIMIKNSTGIAKNMEVIIACYAADNSLLAAGLGKHSVVSGKAETPVTATMCLPSNVDGVTVRMYLWENTVNMIPYCNGIDFVPAP